MTIIALNHGEVTQASALQPQRTVAEFFAGIGLMRLGLETQGWTIAFANDIDPDKEAMYTAHFRDRCNDFVRGDVHQLPSDSVPSVFLATASFPCTDLSLAGSRDGLHGPQSSAFWGFTHVLDELGARRPPLVMIENVPDFLTSNSGRDFPAAMRELNRLGYSVDAFIIDAQHFVPQSRKRLFIVGTHDDMYSQPGTILSPFISEVRPRKLVEMMLRRENGVRWRIRSLPPLPASEKRLDDVLEDVPDSDPMWWSQQRVEKLLNQMSSRHRQILDDMRAGTNYSYGTAFRRMRVDKDTAEKRSMAELRTDGIAGCLRTPKGGSAKQILVKAGKGVCRVRLITPREAARLMGADDYTLPDSLDRALFGFGDAVAVPVVSWVAEYYLNPLVQELAATSNDTTLASAVQA